MQLTNAGSRPFLLSAPIKGEQPAEPIFKMLRLTQHGLMCINTTSNVPTGSSSDLATLPKGGGT